MVIEDYDDYDEAETWPIMCMALKRGGAGKA